MLKLLSSYVYRSLGLNYDVKINSGIENMH